MVGYDSWADKIYYIFSQKYSPCKKYINYIIVNKKKKLNHK